LLASLLLAALLGLKGCAGLPAGADPQALRAAQASFAIGAVPDAANPADGAIAPASAALGQAATASGSAQPPVRLSGRAYVPDAPPGLANVQDGKVSGAPVRITDATSGRLIAKGVTYYDGSFMIDVPLAKGQKALLVSIELVDKADKTHTTRLSAPVLLTAGQAEASVALSPGSTAVVAFLSDLAASQAGLPGAPAEGLELPNGPSLATHELSSLIAGLAPEGSETLTQVADAAPELKDPGTLQGLRTGIERLAKRMSRGRISRASLVGS
jgi:hypothetical protein